VRAQQSGHHDRDETKQLIDDLLQNPAVQAGAIPFLVALAVSAMLARTRFLAIAQLAGFLSLVALAIGFSFESLTATKRLVLIGIGTGAAALLLELRGRLTRPWVVGVSLVVAAASIWMLWRLLAQKDAGAAALAGGLAFLYVFAMGASMLEVGADPVRGASAGLMVGLGTGALAVLGASAVLGVVGVSLGAAAGATLLVQMLRGKPAATGATISLPAGAIAALAGVLAVASASLPWYVLIPVVAAPWATRLVPPTVQPLWLRAFLSALAALVPVIAAVALAWAAASAS
jgi:hypothetical protein